MGTQSNTTTLASEPIMSHWRIILCAAAMCGIQVCYAAQINLGTAELLLLGISERAVSLAWLAGPLSGLIIQPIVGFASDACTSPMGRRRPFLIAGTIFTAASLLLFANAVPIATWLAPAIATRLALVLAVCAFFALDFSIQAIQAPLRALVTDVVPRKQRAVANAYVGVFTGLGNMIGGLLTALNLKTMLPIFDTNTQALFAISTLVLIVSVSCTVISTPERPLQPGYEALDDTSNYDGSPQRTNYADPDANVDSSVLLLTPISRRTSSWRRMMITLRGIPRPFWQVFAVQLCTWCGFFTLFVYVNTWVGKDIYLGDGTAPKGSAARETFEKGVRLGGKGNALTAVVTLLYALILPYLLRQFGTIPVYLFSQIVEAVCLLMAPFLRGKVGQDPDAVLRMATMIDIGMFGIVWATTMGVPWTLVGDALDSDRWYAKRMGLFTTLFNASQSFPQLVVAFAAPAILALAKEDPAWVMFSGGCCAVVGAVLVAVLRFDTETFGG